MARKENTFYIRVIEAKDVKGQEFDSYSIVKSNYREIGRSEVIFNNINPMWDDEFITVLEEGFESAEVILWEEKGKMFDDVPLGKIYITPEMVSQSKGSLIEKWINLYPASTEGGAKGDVTVELTLKEDKLGIKLISGNDLISADVNGYSDPYVIFHLLPDEKCTVEKKSKTKKKTLNPKFDELFEFKIEGGIQPNHKLLATVWDWDRITNDDYMGFFEVPLSKLKIGETKLMNIPLRPKPADIEITEQSETSKATAFALAYQKLPSEPKPSDTPLGSLRVKFKYSEDVILSEDKYGNLMKVIASEKYILPVVLGKISNERESAAWALVKFTHHHNDAVLFLNSIINHEIQSTLDPNTIFRGNSMSSKAVDVFMKLIALQYLSETLSGFIKEVITSKKNFEVDKTRLEKGEDINKNWKNAKEAVNEVLNLIFASKAAVPRQIREVFMNLRTTVQKKWPEDQAVPYTAVSGFIFLRLFVAAILNPHLFGLWHEIPDKKSSRNLTIIAKTVQNTANLVPFGQKEAFMENMNEVIHARIPHMKKFIEDTSNVSDQSMENLKAKKIEKKKSFSFFKKKEKVTGVNGVLKGFVEYDVAKECEQIYQHFSKNLTEITNAAQQENVPESLLTDLKKEIEDLQKIHESSVSS